MYSIENRREAEANGTIKLGQEQKRNYATRRKKKSLSTN